MLQSAELTTSQRCFAERAQAALGLGDWSVRYTISDGESDCVGHVNVRPEYRDAAITLYSKAITELAKDGFAETIERVLLHELCEVAVAECDHAGLPEWLANCAPVVAARDLVADKLARTCERLGLVAYSGLFLGDVPIEEVAKQASGSVEVSRG